MLIGRVSSGRVCYQEAVKSGLSPWGQFTENIVQQYADLKVKLKGCFYWVNKQNKTKTWEEGPTFLPDIEDHRTV